MSLIVKDTHVWIIVACPGLNSLDTEMFTGANRNQWVHHERSFNFNVDFVFWTFWKCVQTTFLLQERRKLWGFWKFSCSERDERRHFSLKAEERRHGTSLFHETLLAIRLVRELFPSDQQLWITMIVTSKFQKHSRDGICYNSPNGRFSPNIDPSMVLFSTEPRMDNISQALSPISLYTCLLMSILNLKPAHIPLKCRCLSKKEEWSQEDHIP
jgi:hypothetical protein